MWLGVFGIIIAVLCAALAVVSAGAFTIILIPIAFIALMSAGASFWGARKAGVRAATDTDAGIGSERQETVRHGDIASEAGDGREPATPEELLNARRRSS